MSDNTSSGGYGVWKFDKLIGTDNYRPWARNMKRLMKWEGYWEVVDGSEFCPTLWTEEKDDTGKVTKAAPTTAEKTELERIHKEWSVKNRRAAQLLVMYCTDKPASMIEDIEDAFLIWCILKENHQDSGFTARHTAFQKLTATTVGDYEGSVDSYIYGIRTNAKDLKNMNATVPDWILVSILLNNLDDKYIDFVHRIVVKATGEPDFEEVVKLLYKEDRQAKREVVSTAMAAARAKAQKSLK